MKIFVAFVILSLSPLSFAEDYESVKKVLKSNCVNCHNPGYAAGGIDLSSYEGVLKVIEPYEPDSSLLLDVILGRNGATQMPLGKSRLSKEDIDDVRFWIEDGAYED
jgi:mono/diheme cytochrome c family protein